MENEGIRLFKFWFSVSRPEQERRFLSRRNDPLKQWKLSPVDVASRDKWEEYTEAKNSMFRSTHTKHAPWVVIKSDCKKRARLACMRYLLKALPYEGKDDAVIGIPDPRLVGPPDGVTLVGARKPRKTIADMQVLAEKKQGKCLSKTYVNMKTRLLWECRNGHIWEATPASISRGSWCRQCPKTGDETPEELLADPAGSTVPGGPTGSPVSAESTEPAVPEMVKEGTGNN